MTATPPLALATLRNRPRIVCSWCGETCDTGECHDCGAVRVVLHSDAATADRDALREAGRRV
jgi:hypothetical protein